MPGLDKVLERVLNDRTDSNIGFGDLCKVVDRLGFVECIRGDHHIFTKSGVREIPNLPPRQDGKAKPYQVKPVREVLSTYGLTKIP